jgi:hypothetical protein
MKPLSSKGSSNKKLRSRHLTLDQGDPLSISDARNLHTNISETPANNKSEDQFSNIKTRNEELLLLSPNDQENEKGHNSKLRRNNFVKSGRLSYKAKDNFRIDALGLFTGQHNSFGEKKNSPVTSPLEILHQKDNSSQKLFTKLAKTFDKNKMSKTIIHEEAVDPRFCEYTQDQSVKNYASFQSQSTNKSKKLLQTSVAPINIHKSPNMKCSSSPNSRLEKIFKEFKNTGINCNFNVLNDRSETGVPFKRSEDKPKTRIGIHSSNFYQMTNPLKRPNLKSPQKFLGSRS